MTAGHINMVKEILAEKNAYTQQASIKEEDFQIAIKLFVKIAILSTEKLIKVSPKSSSTLSTKIRKFVKKHSYKFWQVCETGIPFSMLDSAVSEVALNKVLVSRGSIIVHLINQNDTGWLTEEELDEKFGEAFNNLNIGKVGRACLDLKRAYTCDGDKRAGYYLLWLIKHTSGCDFKIPSRDIFDASSVKKVLSEFLNSTMSLLKYPSTFIELLFFRLWRLDYPMYQDLLEKNCHEIFLKLTVNKF